MIFSDSLIIVISVTIVILTSFVSGGVRNNSRSTRCVSNYATVSEPIANRTISGSNFGNNSNITLISDLLHVDNSTISSPLKPTSGENIQSGFNFTDNSGLIMEQLAVFVSSGNYSDIFSKPIEDIKSSLLVVPDADISDGTISQQRNAHTSPSNNQEYSSDTFFYVSNPEKHTSQNCYIIKMKESVKKNTFDKLSEIFGAIDAKIYKKYKHGFFGYSICFAENILPLALMKEIPAIEFIERDNIVKSSQIQEKAPWGLARLNSPDPRSNYFSFEATGEGVTVYVIDSGLVETKELLDRGKLGFTAFSDQPADCAGHGTEVASIIAGTNVGVAKKANVVVAQVLDCLGDGKNSDLIDAISWIIETHQKPAIINMSLGGDRSPSIEKAVKAAVAAGISVIVAAGNSNVDACTQSPAAVAEAITVAASTQKNNRAKFSNFGPCVDIFAPGVDILAATTQQKSRNGWNFASGTSFAAPLVAGVAALLLEKNPLWNPIQLEDELKKLGAVGAISKKTLGGSPNILLQAPVSNSKLPIFVKLADPSYLPMLGYHTSSIVTAELILVICSFICAALALLATGIALYRRHRKRITSYDTSISNEELKHSIFNSQRPSVFFPWKHYQMVYSYLLRRSIRYFNQKTSPNVSNTNTFIYGTSAAVFFGGICYAAVPLYRIFCNATGFAGTPKTGHYILDPKKLDGSAKGREIKITFISNTARSMPWKFTPQTKYLTVRPGQSALAFYHAYNPTDREIIGMSTYNIIPAKAAPYFNKIQCFCFEEQRLGSKEEVEMPVFFYIDPEFADNTGMESVDEIVLSYTFFDTSKTKST